VVTFEGEVVGGTTDQIKSDKERELHGIHNQLQKTQEMIESIPDTLDEVLNDQYEEIEEIIESQELDDEEKRQRVRDKLRVGLERGLPTIVYEGSSERE
jgi:peptidoglycan hydrolase CwlO-like protein